MEAMIGAQRPGAPPEHERERTPQAVLDALIEPGVSFMVEYTLTEAHQTAVGNCAAVFSDDPSKRAACVAKAREEFAADVIRFREDDEGQLWWQIFRRQGEELLETHSAKIAFSEVGPRSVTMTIVGASKGKRPLLRNTQKFVINVPDEYRIELNDPELGLLVYDAKVGLVR